MKFSTFNLRHQLVMPPKKNRDGMTLVEQDRLDKKNERNKKEWANKPLTQCEHCPKKVKNMRKHIMQVHPQIHPTGRYGCGPRWPCYVPP